jgi:hypothetical protein
VNAGKNKLPGVPQLSGHVVAYIPKRIKVLVSKLLINYGILILIANI